MYRWPAPDEVSNVSIEITSAQGVGDEVDRVRVTTARMLDRGVEIAALANGRLTEVVTPEAMVKLVAVPIVPPVALTNDAVPVQDAAVPLDDAVAILVRLIRAVSELPNPNGGKFSVRVAVVVVCANAALRAHTDKAQHIMDRLNIHTSFCFCRNMKRGLITRSSSGLDGESPTHVAL
jgi:hypothetical protein